LQQLTKKIRVLASLYAILELGENSEKTVLKYNARVQAPEAIA
jgi:hypothetical protein